MDCDSGPTEPGGGTGLTSTGSGTRGTIRVASGRTLVVNALVANEDLCWAGIDGDGGTPECGNCRRQCSR